MYLFESPKKLGAWLYCTALPSHTDLLCVLLSIMFLLHHVPWHKKGMLYRSTVTVPKPCLSSLHDALFMFVEGTAPLIPVFWAWFLPSLAECSCIPDRAQLPCTDPFGECCVQKRHSNIPVALHSMHVSSIFLQEPEILQSTSSKLITKSDLTLRGVIVNMASRRMLMTRIILFSSSSVLWIDPKSPNESKKCILREKVFLRSKSKLQYLSCCNKNSLIYFLPSGFPF